MIVKKLECPILGLARPKTDTYPHQNAKHQARKSRSRNSNIFIRVAIAGRLGNPSHLGGSPV